MDISTNLYSDMSGYASMTAHMNQRKYEKSVLICSDFSVLLQKCCLLHNGCSGILTIFLITELIFRWTINSFVFYSLSPT